MQSGKGRTDHSHPLCLTCPAGAKSCDRSSMACCRSCVLHSAGYGAELAGNQKRALELAARKDIQAAIVVHSTDLAGLRQKLRCKFPTTILVGHRTDEIVRPGHALQGTDAFPEDALDEQKLLDRLSQSTTLLGSKGNETVPAPVKIGDCKLDLAGYTFVDGSGREIRLTRAETALLTALVDSPRRVLSRDQLRYAVAGRGAEPYDRSVDMLVARLRRKIESDPKAPRFILSVQGIGYKFDVRPQSAANGEAIDPERFNGSSRGEAIPASTPGQGSAAPRCEPERRQLTVLSCGLVDSTALAVNLDPEDFGDIIRRFQEICTSVITHWGGAVLNCRTSLRRARHRQVPCHQDLVRSYRRRTAYRYPVSMLSALHQQSILSHYQSARACGSFRARGHARPKAWKAGSCALSGRRSNAGGYPLVRSLTVDPYGQIQFIAGSHATTAEGAYDRRAAPTASRSRAYAAGCHCVRGCALDRFEYARAARSMHRVNQGCSCFRRDQFQARILPDLARRVACNHAEAQSVGARTNRGHHSWRSRKQGVAMRTPRTDSQQVRRRSLVRRGTHENGARIWAAAR